MFDKSDVGCYGDGAKGHGHIRKVLAMLVAEVIGANDVEEELRAEPSDDFSEEDNALELLNQHCLGVQFALCDGDLLLLSEEELDS